MINFKRYVRAWLARRTARDLIEGPNPSTVHNFLHLAPDEHLEAPDFALAYLAKSSNFVPDLNEVFFSE